MYPCNVIRDLLPMYYDGICSEVSVGEVEIHLGQCPGCAEYYRLMRQNGAAPIMPANNPIEQQRVKAVKKAKRKIRNKGILTVIGAIFLIVFIQIVALFAIVGVLGLDYYTAKVEVNTDIATYDKFIKKEKLMSANTDIFPEKITDDMSVKDFKSVYYNPFDPQYLGYLVVDYKESDYKREVNRLKEYNSTEYLGNYGVTGFDEDYTLLAVCADDYYGFVYALTDNED
ncbi:MAG: zf-HC2 domain-containing protein, partial [Lachnospira sp.]|nr:zf-HC2 domain-containing protein [Lachnospira sp.]